MNCRGMVSAAFVSMLGAAVGACTPQAPPPDFSLPSCTVPATGLPDNIYCTGLYKSLKKDLSDGVMPYTPGAVLWSDGAEKHRFLFLPPGAQIDTTDLDSWKFPVDTKAWKEFRVDGKLIETR